MKAPFLLLFLLATTLYAQAQGYAVNGAVQSAQNKETLPGATVQLIRLPDSVRTATATDKDGNFGFQAVKPGQYALQMNYLGFKTFTRTVQVQNAAVLLGPLLLEEATNTLNEIKIVGKIPLGSQKGDTTVFNAGAFKVAADASAEDLVTKLPGVTTVDGKIQAQGEEIRQILVDGKRFFGEDAATALRNLPAEVIENIEIFDKKSDQAEFSGFDDGNRAKTLNIVTKPNRRQGKFGKVSVGMGPDKKYMAGTSLNIFKGDRRFTINGLSNNINMQDFSVGEAPGGGMRGRRGGGAGISTTNNFGLNYSDFWGKKMEVSGNYNYSNTRNENNRLVFRDYQISRFYDQQNSDESYTTNRNENHQFNFRLDYKINDRNRLLITPRFSIQKSNSSANTIGRSIFDADSTNQTYDATTLTSTDDLSNADNYSYNLGNDINFSHRFNKPGRTFTVNLNTGYNLNNGDTYRITNVEDFDRPDRSIYLNQLIKAERGGFNWRANIALGEKVGEKAQVQAEYSISNRVEDSERLAYDMGEVDYTDLNARLSNSFESDYLTQQAKTSYQYNSDKVRVQVQAQYQMANLQNEQEFPTTYRVNRTFHNLLPNAQFEYKFTKTKNLQIDYRTNTNAPSVTQLQEVLDNTNPLRFRTGNAGLVQAYQNSVNVRYRSFDTETNKVFSFFVTAAQTNSFITNSTLELREEDAAWLGIAPSLGAQYIRPVNLDGNWSARSFVSYGQPLNLLKSNINFNGSVGYNKTPGLFNNEMFFSTTTNYGLGASLSSNISENVDFNFSTNANYNVLSTTLRRSQNNNNNNFFNQSTNLRANLRFWKGLVYRTELSHQLNAGLSSNLRSTNYTLLNMSLSKKVFKSQKGEVSLSVNDLLRQNISVQRTQTDAFVQDTQTSVLQRFFMLTFSYNIRTFNGPVPGERGPGQRGPGGRGNMRQGGGRNGG
ncbi:outer membrane beta-barrel protein [Rufibacter sediminis]|uniref:Outer membrane beta-barrel protein n=1 Tax=Rufibacter sediminis TaxID=2762756 RepID=A0ABR6VNS0_9BACT|nr:TonB-dependent receptor [Rufibacter sediminis]MBC3538560.1 outer membrane beta-barrel protein [Rufibacter sediminis]